MIMMDITVSLMLLTIRLMTDCHIALAASPIPIQKESQNLTIGIAKEVLLNPLTWLPALAYLSEYTVHTSHVYNLY